MYHKFVWEISALGIWRMG